MLDVQCGASAADAGIGVRVVRRASHATAWKLAQRPANQLIPTPNRHLAVQVCVHRCGLHSQPGCLPFTFYPAMPGNSTACPDEKWQVQRPAMAAAVGQEAADRRFEGAVRCGGRRGMWQSQPQRMWPFLLASLQAFQLSTAAQGPPPPPSAVPWNAGLQGGVPADHAGPICA